MELEGCRHRTCDAQTSGGWRRCRLLKPVGVLLLSRQALTRRPVLPSPLGAARLASSTPLATPFGLMQHLRPIGRRNHRARRPFDPHHRRRPLSAVASHPCPKGDPLEAAAGARPRAVAGAEGLCDTASGSPHKEPPRPMTRTAPPDMACSPGTFCMTHNWPSKTLATNAEVFDLLLELRGNDGCLAVNRSHTTAWYPRSTENQEISSRALRSSGWSARPSVPSGLPRGSSRIRVNRPRWIPDTTLLR